MGIYFDNNATTSVDPRVLEAMLPWLSTQCGNASSLHSHGRPARTAIDTAREQVAALVGAQPGEVVFTSGGTEANNLAVRGISAARKGALVFSAIEHPSVKESCEAQSFDGRPVIEIPANLAGATDVAALEDIVQNTSDVAFVCLMRANNETGVLQPMAQARDITAEKGIPLHCDAVQAVGKMPVSFSDLAVDSMTLSAHKIHGPKGAGALIFKSSLPLRPPTFGGGQEKLFRPGTENVAAIVGFGRAAELALAERGQRIEKMRGLRTRLLAGLDQLDANIEVFGRDAAALPNTLQFAVPGFDGEALLMALDRHGVSVSSGSACASGKGEPSHVLLAMGIPEHRARGAIRVSLSAENTAAEVDEFLAALATIRQSLQMKMPAMMGAVVNGAQA